MKRVALLILGGGATLLLVLQIALLGVNHVRAAYPVLGLRFERQVVSSFSDVDIDDYIRRRSLIIESHPVTIRANGFTDHLTARQLGAQYDKGRIRQHLKAVGREGSLFRNIIAQDAALLGLDNERLGYPDINEDRARKYLGRIAPQTVVIGKNASFVLQNNSVAIAAEVPASHIDVTKAIVAIREYDSQGAAASLTLPVTQASPPITGKDLQPLLPQVAAIVEQPITLQANNKEVTISKEQVLSFITVNKPVDPASVALSSPTPSPQGTASAAPTAKPAIALAGTAATLGFNDTAISNAIDQLAQQLDHAPKPKIIKGGTVVDKGDAGLQVNGPHAKVAVIARLIDLGRTPAAAATAATATPRPTAGPTPKATSSSSASPQASPTASPTPGPTPAKSPSHVIAIPTEQLEPPVIKQPADPPRAAPRAPSPSSPASPQPASGGKVTLTFDDGPNALYTGEVLDILKQRHVHATFFVVGKNVLNFPNVAKRITAEGHTIGNHSFTHSDLPLLSPAAITGEIVDTQKAVNSTTGVTPTIFRPPYGSMNATVRGAATQQKLDVQLWTVDPRDWSRPGSSVIAQRVLSAAAPGSNILLHVLYQQTVDALPDIISGLQAKGLL